MKKIIRLDAFKEDKAMDKQFVSRKWRSCSSEIDNAAYALLEKYGMEDDMPIDPIKLANKMGISVAQGLFAKSDVSGVLTKVNGSPVIVVNKLDSFRRKRFTIAHEIGHFALNHVNINDSKFNDVFRDGTNSPEEREANRFAAALLVNAKDLKNKVNKFKAAGANNAYMFNLLADEYDVSIQTIKHRMQSVGI
nr:ImmA/IrrE family metallo-endopeptidase [uncultured Cellulosilyticum sp.]